MTFFILPFPPDGVIVLLPCRPCCAIADSGHLHSADHVRSDCGCVATMGVITLTRHILALSAYLHVTIVIKAC